MTKNQQTKLNKTYCQSTSVYHQYEISLKELSKHTICYSIALTLFRMGLFGTAHGWGAKKATLPKIYYTYPAMMKPGTFIPYLKKIQKNINRVTHPLSSADISIFSPEISNFFYVKKYRHRLRSTT